MSHRLPAPALSLLLPILMAAPLRAQDHATHDHAAMAGRDTAYAAMQERGKSAMGVDQYTSAHRFDDAADGGRIVLQRDRSDTAGTRVMALHRRHITYRFEPLAGGGQVRILTHDPAAIQAIHRFLAFQRTEHRAPGKAL